MVDGVLYTMGARPLSVAGVGDGGEATEIDPDAKAYVIALDANTGKELWATEVGDLFENNWGNGPRSTPTVDGDWLYALGAKGDLVCLRREDGAVRWRKSFTEDLGGGIPQWGFPNRYSWMAIKWSAPREGARERWRLSTSVRVR